MSIIYTDGFPHLEGTILGPAQHTEEWYAARNAADITGSVIGELFTDARDKRCRDIAYKQVTGKPVPRYDTRWAQQAMQHGTDMEPFARAAASEAMGQPIYEHRCIIKGKMLDSPDGWFETYDEDGIVGVEIKCPTSIDRFLDSFAVEDWPSLLEYDAVYAHQLCFHCRMMGAKYGLFVWYTNDPNLIEADLFMHWVFLDLDAEDMPDLALYEQALQEAYPQIDKWADRFARQQEDNKDLDVKHPLPF